MIGFCSADASVQVCAVLTEEDKLVMPDNSLQQVKAYLDTLPFLMYR